MPMLRYTIKSVLRTISKELFFFSVNGKHLSTFKIQGPLSHVEEEQNTEEAHRL